MRNLSVLLLVLAGCAAAKEDAAYSAGFEDCFQKATTCEAYLACWQDNQRAHHQAVTGSCKGGSDAGTDR